jgi:hypothetical protein
MIIQHFLTFSLPEKVEWQDASLLLQDGSIIDAHCFHRKQNVGKDLLV